MVCGLTTTLRLARVRPAAVRGAGSLVSCRNSLLRGANSRRQSSTLPEVESEPVTRESSLAGKSDCEEEDTARFAALQEHGLGIGERLSTERVGMAAALRTRGWCVIDGFLGDAACMITRTEATQLRLDGKYAQSYSQVAETGEKLWRDGVYAMELDGSSWRTAPLLVVYISELMRELPPLMNAEFSGLALDPAVFGHKLAVSVGGGSHYPKHVDNVLGAPADTRKLTAIYYMNPAWDESNGGSIRLFDSLDEPGYTEVAPAGDRLLLFWSDLLVHAVGESHHTHDAAHRYTFTTWLSTQNPAALLDTRDPHYALRVKHFPTHG